MHHFKERTTAVFHDIKNFNLLSKETAIYTFSAKIVPIQ
jgi:hypothetical protein